MIVASCWNWPGAWPAEIVVEDPLNTPEHEAPPRTTLARYGSWPVVIAVLLGAIIIGSAVSYLLAGLLFGEDGGSASSTGFLATPRVLFLAIVVSDAVLLGAVYLLLVRRGVTTWRDLGLGRPEVTNPVLRGLGYGLLFLLVAGGVSLALAALGIQQNQAQQFPIEGTGTLGKASILLAGIAFAPFAEEIFFRGFIFRAMAERKGLVRGLLYSSALFSLVHGNVAAFLPLLAGAAVLALSFQRTRTLWVPIIAHAVNNAVALTVLVLAT
ncbi:MAG: CPBP family intramembrane glutamic endopeptidase [Thermoleophilia bacterium]